MPHSWLTAFALVDGFRRSPCTKHRPHPPGSVRRIAGRIVATSMLALAFLAVLVLPAHGDITIHKSPADLSVQCAGDVPPADADPADNSLDPYELYATTDCQTSSVTVSHVDSSDGGSCPETITRTYTLEDPCGAWVQTAQTFTIEDTTPPTIGTPASDLTVECDGSGNTAELAGWLSSYGGAAASDVCGGVTWSDDYVALSDDCGATGSATVTFTATDECGNGASTTATFTIEDTTPPTIGAIVVPQVLITDDYICGATVLFSTTVVSDVCCIDEGGIGVAATITSGTAELDPVQLTTNETVEDWSVEVAAWVLLSDLSTCAADVTFTVTAVDCCGNSTTRSGTGTVHDRCPPHFTEDPPAQNTIKLPPDAGSSNDPGGYSVDGATVFECDGSYNVAEINAWLALAAALDSCNGPATWGPTSVDLFVAGPLGWLNWYGQECIGVNPDGTFTDVGEFCGGFGADGYSSTGRGEVVFEAVDACGNRITTDDAHDPAWSSPSFVILDTIPPVAVDDPQLGFSYDLVRSDVLCFVESIDGLLRFVLREDTPVYLDVLSNDSDICRTGLHIAETTRPSYGSAAIMDASFTLVGGCAGTYVRYAAAADYQGADAFDYVARDCSGNTTTAHVDVYVFQKNVVLDSYLTGPLDLPLRLRLETMDDMLLRVANPGAFHYGFTFAGPPTHGVIVGDLMSVGYEGAHASVALTYVPADGFVGRELLEWRVQDPFGLVQSAVLDIQIVPTAGPLPFPDVVPTFHRGQLVSLFVPVSFHDAGGIDGVRLEEVEPPGVVVRTLAGAELRGLLGGPNADASIPILTLRTERLTAGTYRILVPVGPADTVRVGLRVTEEGE